MSHRLSHAYYLLLALAATVVSFHPAAALAGLSPVWVGVAALPALLFLYLRRQVAPSILVFLFFILLLAGQARVGRELARGEEGREERLSLAYTEVEEVLGAEVDTLLRWTGAIGSDSELIPLLRGAADRKERAALFARLAVLADSLTVRSVWGSPAFELYREGEGEPAAWYGEVPDLSEPGPRGVIRLESDPLRIHLVVDFPVQVRGRRTPVGSVRAIVPIGARPLTLAERLRERVEGELRFFPLGSDEGRPLRVREGSEIGRVLVTLTDTAGRAREIEEKVENLCTLLLLLFWLLLLPRRARVDAGDGSATPSVLRERVRTIPIGTIVIVRVLFLVLDIPRRIGLGGDLSGPWSFASPLFFGLLRSPADLLLTGLSLFLVFLVLRERASARGRGSAAPGRLRLLPLLAIGAILSAATVGFDLLVREALTSTTLVLFDGPNPWGALPVMMMDVALLLIGAAYLLLVDTGFVWAARFGAPGPGAAERHGLVLRVAFGTFFALTVLLLSRLVLRGGWWFLLSPALTLCIGLLLFYLLRGRGWRIWNGLGFLVAVAIVCYSPLRNGWEENARVQVEERALRFAEPADEWKRFLLEETLRFFEEDETLRERLASNEAGALEREAFLAWIRSGLSRYDYSVEIRIVDRQGAVVSRFALDMPEESPVRSAFVFREVRRAGETKIFSGRRRVAGEAVEIYTGAAPVEDDGELIGAVVVSLPYFYENLEYAARLPTTSYEIFENYRTVEGTLTRPPEALHVLLYKNGELERASGDRLPRDTVLPGSLWSEIERSGSAWGEQEIGGVPHRVFYTVWKEPAGGQALAFALPEKTSLQNLLDLIDIVLTFFFQGLFLSVIASPLLLLPLLRKDGAGRLKLEVTFQDKLVLAFLVVALLPAVLLGVAGRRMVAERLREDGEQEVRTAIQAVRYALDQDALDEAEELARSTLVRRRVLGIEEGEELVDLELSLKRFAIFSPEGELILQNGKIGAVDGSLLSEVMEKRTPLTAFTGGEDLSLVALVPITLEGFEENPEGILLLSRPIDEAWVAPLGERLDLDLSFYLSGSIEASTRYELYQAGLLPHRLPAPVYVPLELRGEKVRFTGERIGDVPYLVGYRVLRGFHGEPEGTLAVPLLFREREARADLEKAYGAITYLSFFTLIVVVLLAEGMGQRIGRPIRDLSRGMARISSGELELSIPVRSGGEIGRLVQAFNRMARDLKQSRDALTERSRYIETVMGSVGAGVVAFDTKGAVVSANRAASQILGVTADRIEGKPLDSVAGGRFHRLHRIVAALDPKRDQVHEEEVELPTEEGKMTIRVVATAISDEEGRELGKVIVFEDLTALIQSKKLLAWGEMARQVAHEIKNPLTPMKLSVQHLKQAFHDAHPRFPEILDESADLIIEEIDSLQRIATEFSTFARMPRREIRPVPAAALVRETARLYGEGFPDVDLTVDVTDDLPALLVDREEARRLLINFMENAVQAMGGKGKLHVSARVGDGSPGPEAGWELWETTSERGVAGPTVVIRIADDGPGIGEAARGKLFEPYFSTKTNGTGLGLAICRAIVQDYGGVIAIGSTPGKGTMAMITLPAPPSL